MQASNLTLRIIFSIFLIFSSFNIKAISDAALKEHADKLKIGIELIEENKLNQAYKHAKSLGPIAKRLLLTKIYILQPTKYSFAEISEFANKNSKYPEFYKLKRAVEQTIFHKNQYNAYLNWFAKYKPVSYEGHMLRYQAYMQKLQLKKTKTNHEIALAKQYIKDVWLNNILPTNIQRDFLTKHRIKLRHGDHVDRINMLLWHNQVTQAEELLPLVNDNFQKMFKVRIAAINKRASTLKFHSKLPENYKYRSGIAYSLANYKLRKNFKADISDILLKASYDKKYYAKWARLKLWYARELIEQKKYQKAYKILKSVKSESYNNKADAEWMMGWVSLRFLKKPALALKHFQNFDRMVAMPISKARAAYWQARAYEKLNDHNSKIKYLKEAAKYPQYFYGQLASNSLRVPQIKLPNDQIANLEISNWANENKNMIALKMLAMANDNELARDYCKYIALKTKNLAKLKMLAKIGHDYKDYNIAVTTAKLASQKHIYLTEDNYPAPYKLPLRPEQALTYSIIRQESVFDIKAESCANAYGLMQLIKPTAKHAAKLAKVKFKKHKLTNDADYNIKLGTTKLIELLNYYDNSYILAIAAYNAGEHNINKWLKRYGDVREFRYLYSIIDWLEMIPYHETRNYVQRVLENVQVYRSLYTKNSHLAIEQDLRSNSPRF